MSSSSMEHATLNILAGTIKNVGNSFILDRRTRGVSKRTIEFYSVELKYFQRFLDSEKIMIIGELEDPDIIRKYLLSVSSHRNKGGVAVSYRVVKCFLNWFESETDGDFVSPMKKIKVSSGNNQPIEGISTDEVIRMVESCTTKQGLRDKAILYFLFDSGVRASELINLNFGDVDILNGIIKILHGKGDKYREVFIGSKTRKAIRAYLKTREDVKPKSPLFVTDEGERIAFSGLRQIVRRCSERAGIKTHGLHDFRRGAALSMLRNDCSLITVSKILGHSSLTVTARYLAQNQADLKEGHKKSSPVDNL